MTVGGSEGIFLSKFIEFTTFKAWTSRSDVVGHEIFDFAGYKIKSSWFLEKVKIKNLDENEEQEFLIRQWLDKNSEKGISFLKNFQDHYFFTKIFLKPECDFVSMNNFYLI